MSVWAKGILLVCALVIGVGVGVSEGWAAEKRTEATAKPDQKAANGIQPVAMEPPCEEDPDYCDPEPAGSISASPNPCTTAAGASSCTSTISWSSNDPNGTEVWVSDLSYNNYQFFARGQTGSQAASWITTSGHRFYLAAGGIYVASIEVSANAPALYNDAMIESVSVPASMDAGAQHMLTIRMRNIGTTTWTHPGQHLAFTDDQNITRWNVVQSVVTQPVPPGAVADYQFQVSAPASGGAFNLQWRMIQPGVEWFGTTVNAPIQVTPPYNNAVFDSQSVPTTMQPGALYTVTVKMKNNGTKVWRPALNHRLGSQNPHDNTLWTGSNRVGSSASSVLPGQIGIFTFNVTAPSTPGTYNFQWKMLEEGVEWFGTPSTNVAVQVVWPPLTGIHTTYDALGRVISVRQDSELGPLVTTKEYLNGFQTRVTNPRGYQTVTQYQVFDQPAAGAPSGITMFAGATTVATEIYRDIFGKPTQLKRRNGDGSLSSSRYFTYDGYQRLCKTIEPETGATMMDYDAAGNLAWTAAGISAPGASTCNHTEAAGSGRVVHRTYDARNRLNSLMFPDGLGNQEWQYWPDGMPKQITTYNSAGGTQVVNAYNYNKRRLLSGESVSQPGWYAWTIGYGYDAIGNLAGQQYPTGLYVDYAPNALGQPTRAGNFAQNASYYPNGAIKQFTYGNGIIHTMSQNARQLPKISADSGILSYEVGFDANGNVDVIYDRVQGDHYSRWMEYDGLDRLTAAGSCHFGGDCWHRFTYDALDNLKSWKLPGVKDYANYYYDPTTNRLTNIQNGAGASLVGLGYDVQGNLANKNGQAYTFDFGNRLRDVAGKEGYRYDGYGRRVLNWRPAAGTMTFSFYSQPGQLIYQENTTNTLAIENVYLGGNLVAERERNWVTNTYATKYQHTDALGSPVAVTNDAGQLVERTQYEPYGAAIGKPNYDGIGYTGHVMDGATGLSYMQQRYYDPQIGRFLSMDPVTADANTGGNFNRYWYANNNPYKYTDPDGRIVLNIAGGIIGGIVGGVGGAVVTAISGGSKREIVASAIGGIVGGAITGASLGTGASVGAIAAAGVTGGILGETTSQTVENAAKHGSDMGSYSYSVPKIVVSGTLGAADAMTGGMVGELAGPALKEGAKAAMTEGGLLPVKTVTEILVRREESKKPPPSPEKPRVPEERAR